MDAGLEAELSPPLRLALAWAPRHARPATLALFALDTRLAGFLRRGTEPLPVQMRLAWWRDTLGAPPSAWPRGDPLLDELRTWAAPEGLVALVDGWEGLLAETLDREAITGFALGREQAWSALAREVGAARAEPARRPPDSVLGELPTVRADACVVAWPYAHEDGPGSAEHPDVVQVDAPALLLLVRDVAPAHARHPVGQGALGVQPAAG